MAQCKTHHCQRCGPFDCALHLVYTYFFCMVRTAKKTLADMRQMFGFALDRDYVDATPLPA